MSKHSPAPWEIDEIGCVTFNDPQYGKCQVCHVPDIDESEKQRANASLICAAPDLLAACKWLAAWDGSEDDAKMISEACSLARSAIRKAEATP